MSISSERWVQYRVVLPGKPIDPSVARRRLYFSSDKNGGIVPERIFSHQNGALIKGRDNFRFSGFDGGLQILAAGDTAAALLLQSVPAIRLMFADSYEVDSVSDNLKSGYYFATVKKGLMEYEIPSLVIQPHSVDRETATRISKQMLDDHVGTLIQRHLDRELSSVSIFNVSMYEPGIILTEMSIRRIDVVEVRAGRCFVAAKGVTFKSNVHLGGIFHAGYLLDLGHGRIKKICRRQAC